MPTADCFHILNESLLQDLLRGAPQPLVYRRVVDQIVLAAELKCPVLASPPLLMREIARLSAE